MLRSAFLNAVLKDVDEFSIQSLGSKSTRENIVCFLNYYNFAPFPFNLTNKKLFDIFTLGATCFWSRHRAVPCISLFLKLPLQPVGVLLAGCRWATKPKPKARRPCLRRPPNRSTLRVSKRQQKGESQHPAAARSQGSCVKITWFIVIWVIHRIERFYSLKILEKKWKVDDFPWLWCIFLIFY